MIKSFYSKCLYLIILSVVFYLPLSAQLIRSIAGVSIAAIQSTVDAFRTDLGSLNPNVSGSYGTGRREINWDGVPDAFAAPNNLPANFFNVNSPRGIILSTAGSGFQASSSVASGTPIQFGNINPTYSTAFEPFTQQRLITAVGSNIMDVSFFIPGSTTPALVRGFGAVFSDVDIAANTSIKIFDRYGILFGTYNVPNFAGSETFSFLGVSFTDPTISKVRITTGNTALSAVSNDGGSVDLVVMDDFIYGEPIASNASDYFRSKASGNWDNISIWESSSDNSNWHAATLTPDFNANTISILNTHVVTVTANVTVDQLTINSGATVNVITGVNFTVK